MVSEGNILLARNSTDPHPNASDNEGTAETQVQEDQEEQEGTPPGIASEGGEGICNTVYRYPVFFN